MKHIKLPNKQQIFTEIFTNIYSQQVFTEEVLCKSQSTKCCRNNRNDTNTTLAVTYNLGIETVYMNIHKKTPENIRQNIKIDKEAIF